MTGARDVALLALVSLVLTACAGGTLGPPDDDPEPLRSVSAAVIGYAGTDTVVMEGRSPFNEDLVALGTLYGAAGRLDLDLFDPADVSNLALAPPVLTGCLATVAPANLRIADVVRVVSPDESLVLELRNRPFGGDPVGAEYYVFILASHDGEIIGTCDYSARHFSYDLTFQAGWNVASVRTTAFEEGVLERLAATSIGAVPEAAAWYVLP